MASNLVKCTGCNLVICEILAFVKNKMDVMDEDSLRRICETAFTSEEIISAKKLLYDSIPTDKRLKTRKGGKKTRRDIDDIISLLKQTDPDAVPTFVARDLQKLPPITFDHIDVTRLLKDILILKESGNDIREQCVPTETFAVIAREVEELKLVLKTDNYVNVNTRRGNYAQNRCEYDSGPIGLDYMSQFSPNNKINNQPLENTEHKLDMSVHSYYEQQNVTHSINGRSNSNATSIPRMLSPNEAGGTDELSSGVHANPPMSHNSTARAKATISQAATDTAHSESRMCAMDTLSKTQMLHTDTTSMQSESRMCTVDLQTSISDVIETAEQLKS